MLVQLFLFGFIYFLVTWLIPFLLPESSVMTMVAEDSALESMTALCLFIASLLWVGAFFLSKKGNSFLGLSTKRNYIYLLFAAVFFFGAGEEISWGQRILNFETPEVLATNEQEEANLHNMPFLNFTNDDNPFHIHRLLIYFWFTFTVLIPLSATLSTRVRNWLNSIGFPVVPLSIGILFLMSYLASKIYNLTFVGQTYLDADRVMEFRESQQALFFLLIAIYVAFMSRRVNQQVQQPITVHTDDQLSV